ncbi:MAG: pseudouridine synthase [Patescibacteria group bacterium]
MQNSPRTLAENLIRLEKHIANLGLASRREAKDLILKGLVSVNGNVVTDTGFGFDITKDTISVKQDDIKKEYILLYKPRGIETNKTADHLQDIHDVYPQFKHLAPIGRLDADSEGLIILSNDGVLAKVLTQPDSHVGKTYRVTVRESVTENAIKTMSEGILLDGVKTKPAEAVRESEHVFTIVLHEGRKHQIRRMADAVKLTVESLVRVGIGSLGCEGLSVGGFRELSEEEVDELKGL